MKKIYGYLVLAFFLVTLSGCQWSGKQTLPTKPQITTTPSPTPSTPPTIPLPSTVSLPYIILEDGGQSGTLIGCNDSLVTVNVAVPASATNRQSLLTRMYNQLLAQTGKGTYDTSLPNSGLTISSLTSSATGVHVALSGSLPLAGTCDSPRITEQLKKIITQFPQFTTNKITINGVLLEDYLSTK